MSKETIRHWALHYFYGCFVAMWKGLVASAYVSFGAAGANAAGLVDLKSISLQGLLSTIGGTCLFHAVIYFYNHPIPDTISDETDNEVTKP